MPSTLDVVVGSLNVRVRSGEGGGLNKASQQMVRKGWLAFEGESRESMLVVVGEKGAEGYV